MLRILPRRSRHGWSAPERRTYLVLCIVIAVLAGSMLVTLMRTDHQRRLQFEADRTGQWNIIQAIVQLERFGLAVERRVRSDSSITAEEVAQQLDILWSRIPLLAKNPQNGDVFRVVPDFANQIAALEGDLRAIDPLVHDLVPGDRRSYGQIAAGIDSVRSRLNGFNAAVHGERVRASAELRRALGGGYGAALAQLVLVLCSVAILVYLLLQALRRTRHLLLTAETARADALASRAQLQAVIDAVPALIVAWDEADERLFENRTHRQFHSVATMAVADDERLTIEEVVSDGRGRQRVLLTTRVPVHDGDGGTSGRVEVAWDVTERHDNEERIRHLAHHDPLTGLGNRILFQERLAALAADLGATRRSLALLLIDLDRFKEVNDAFGHGFGDELLVEVARRLHARNEPADVLVRLGGDEFAQLLVDEKVEQAAAVRAALVLADIAQPFVLQGREVHIGASVGISIMPSDASQPDALIKHADLALYRAKRDGKSRAVRFDSALQAEVDERRSLELTLQRALREQAFTVVYQPQLELAEGRLFGLEALLRLPSAAGVGARELIDLAEETGLIAAVGDRVLGVVCRQLRAWLDAGLLPPRVSVNVSPTQFAEQALVQTVERHLRHWSIPPQLLELEITESVLLRREDEALRAVSELRRLGVRLALDDFGSGYSSLGYLQDLPLDTLKIDQRFVLQVERDVTSRAIVAAVTGLAHSLGLDVVAEGIETAGQLRCLRELGCDAGQGYFLSAPQAAGGLEGWLSGAAATTALQGGLLLPDRSDRGS